jgi:hypothetical protein
MIIVVTTTPSCVSFDYIVSNNQTAYHLMLTSAGNVLLEEYLKAK